jgi:hypothetical protein
MSPIKLDIYFGNRQSFLIQSISEFIESLSYLFEKLSKYFQSQKIYIILLPLKK